MLKYKVGEHMEQELERVREIEIQINHIQQACAEELAELYKKDGFDEYKPKWQRKISNIAKKYANLLAPLEIEHDELRDIINKKVEEQRKKKYVDPY